MDQRTIVHCAAVCSAVHVRQWGTRRSPREDERSDRRTWLLKPTQTTLVCIVEQCQPVKHGQGVVGPLLNVIMSSNGKQRSVSLVYMYAEMLENFVDWSLAVRHGSGLLGNPAKMELQYCRHGRTKEWSKAVAAQDERLHVNVLIESHESGRSITWTPNSRDQQWIGYLSVDEHFQVMDKALWDRIGDWR